MGSITGLKKGSFTSIDNSGEIRLGNNINPGTAGQALVSGGPNQPARWDIPLGTIQPLTMGTNLSLTSGNPTFDGSIPDTINLISPYFFHDIYDPTVQDTDTLTTSYANIFSSNLFNSFTAQRTSCAIELKVYNENNSSGGANSARLAGSSSTTSGAEFTSFYSTGGRTTERIFHQDHQSDDIYLTITWVLTGLTVGNTYNLYPQATSTHTGNNLFAGGSFPGCILRGYYL